MTRKHFCNATFTNMIFSSVSVFVFIFYVTCSCRCCITVKGRTLSRATEKLKPQITSSDIDAVHRYSSYHSETHHKKSSACENSADIAFRTLFVQPLCDRMEIERPPTTLTRATWWAVGWEAHPWPGVLRSALLRNWSATAGLTHWTSFIWRTLFDLFSQFQNLI